MKFIISLIIFQLLLINIVQAQNNKGIHFQAIARNENGIIIPNKQITIRITLLTDSSFGNKLYQEIKSVTTNMLGLLFIDIGSEESGKVVTIGSFNEINWSAQSLYLQVELDPNNALSFLNAGIEKINYVPLALYADKSNMVESIVPIELGGTGVGSVKEILKLLNIDKTNNTPDSLKPISNAMNVALNEKLKKSDTVYLSNRINAIPKIDSLIINNKINQKLNFTDTIKLSNRINLKLNIADTIGLVNRILLATKNDTVSLSNRINNKISAGTISYNDIVGGLGFVPTKNTYGIFYDTTKQTTTVATATPMKLNFQQLANKISAAINTAGNTTRITVSENGIYQMRYMVQFVKLDPGSDEVSIWIRRNSSAYPNTNANYSILGSGVKNIFTGNYFVELGANDYIELYFSIKNINSNLYGTPATLTTPSRPATPSVYISIQSVN